MRADPEPDLLKVRETYGMKRVKRYNLPPAAKPARRKKE